MQFIETGLKVIGLIVALYLYVYLVMYGIYANDNHVWLKFRTFRKLFKLNPQPYTLHWLYATRDEISLRSLVDLKRTYIIFFGPIDSLRLCIFTLLEFASRNETTRNVNSKFVSLVEKDIRDWEKRNSSFNNADLQDNDIDQPYQN